MIYRLIYTSKRAPETTESDFRTIATFSAMWNRSQGITGLLMVYADDIMQVLEGPEAEVKALADKISQDTRHQDMQILYEKDVPSAEFTKWSMGFRPLDSRAEMDVFFNMTRAELAAQVPKGARWDVQKAVSGFAEQVGLD